MATPKLQTTIQERAENLAKRRVRVHVSGDSALVYGSKGEKYRTFLSDPETNRPSCDCKHWVCVQSKIGADCKHIARLRM